MPPEIEYPDYLSNLANWRMLSCSQDVAGFLNAMWGSRREFVVREQLDRNMASGIYTLFQGDEPVYIGQSKEAWKRIQQHKNEKNWYRSPDIKVMDYYAYAAVRPEHLDIVEKRLLVAIQPKYNIEWARPRKGWAMVQLEDFCRLMRIDPYIAEEICRHKNVRRSGTSYELMDLLWHYVRQDAIH
jgi:hypothetical protein